MTRVDLPLTNHRMSPHESGYLTQRKRGVWHHACYFKRMKKFIVALVCAFHFSNMSLSRADLLLGPHGGQMVQNNGKSYEIVRNIEQHQIQIYAPPRTETELPSSITIRVKKKDKIINRIHLSLMPDTGLGYPAYSKNVPASVLISGGITFELGL